LFTFSNIRNYQDFLRTSQDGCLLAVEHYLSVIDDKKGLNAFLEVYDREALQRARELDSKRNSGKGMGKLHGVVVSLKDVIAYKGHKLSAASKILGNFVSIYNATAVERLLQEDAIIIGRNNCDEFAMGSTNENSAYGPTLNARDPQKVPGGSSGGSAVAVQAGMCMVSLGSDTGGSVRQPADFCGIQGLKPSYGKVSRYGLIAYASSFDQIGIFAISTEDIGIVLEVIAGSDGQDSSYSNKAQEEYSLAILQEPLKFRVAYFREALEHSSLDPEIRKACYGLVQRLKNAGHQVEPIDFEYLDYIVPAYYVLSTAEASSNLSRYDGIRYGYRSPQVVKEVGLTEFYKSTRSEGFGEEVKRRILLGTFVLSAGYQDAYFTRAQKIRKLLINRNELIFNQFDILISPTSPSTAFKIGEKTEDPISMYLADIYTVYANLTGIPAISLPLFTHTNGMPFGIQAMTNRFKEVFLLQFSQQLTNPG
jgi:aspartyl-tRNA(Asn)/glutamyl-tRNA(Gln) amidotransferase subunit A